MLIALADYSKKKGLDLRKLNHGMKALEIQPDIDKVKKKTVEYITDKDAQKLDRLYSLQNEMSNCSKYDYLARICELEEKLQKVLDEKQ